LDFPPLWRKLRTTNAIERCFVEVRRRTRPMVVFPNLSSVEHIVYAILIQVQSAVAKPHPPSFYTSSLTSPLTSPGSVTELTKLV
jgi:transposase-like protein